MDVLIPDSNLDDTLPTKQAIDALQALAWNAWKRERFCVVHTRDLWVWEWSVLNTSWALVAGGDGDDERLQIEAVGTLGDVYRAMRERGISLAHGAYAPLLRVAVHVAREAGAVLRAEFHREGGPLGREAKAPVDARVEALIAESLSVLCPDFGWVVEETPALCGPPRFGEEHTWLVDPNDGTGAFLQGARGSTVSMALLRDGCPVLGVVHAYNDPDDLGDCVAWAEGCGPVTRNDVPVSPPLWQRALSSEAIVALSHEADRRPAINTQLAFPARVLPTPGIARRLALVALGEVDLAVSVYSPKSYDIAAGHALVRAQGGDLFDERGEPIRYTAEGQLQHRATSCFGGPQELIQSVVARPWGSILDVRDNPQAACDLMWHRSTQNIQNASLLDRATGLFAGALIADAATSDPNAGGLAPSSSLSMQAHTLLVRARTFLHHNTLSATPFLARAQDIFAAQTIPHDPELQTLLALLPRHTKLPLSSLARELALGHCRKPSSGPMLRSIALLLVVHRATPKQLVSWVRQEASITHAHPVAQDSAAALCLYLQLTLLSTPDASVETLYARLCEHAVSLGLHKNVILTIQNAPKKCPSDYKSRPLWSLIALQSLIFHTLACPSLGEALGAVSQHAGATRTHAALLGAWFGARMGRRMLDESPYTTLWLRTHRPDDVPMSAWPVDAVHTAERLLGFNPPLTKERPLRAASVEYSIQSTPTSSALVHALASYTVPQEGRFHTSPSALSTFFFLECERFIRYRCTHSKDKEEQGVPLVNEPRTPMMDIVAQDGYHWETLVVEDLLQGLVTIPPGEGPIHTRDFTVEQTVECLRNETPGRYIYQAHFQVPRRFYEVYGVDPSLLKFNNCYPDLIAVLPDPKDPSKRLMRILDVKRSLSIKVMYRVQILLYAMILEQILEEFQIHDARVDLEMGGVWLGQTSAPEPCDLTVVTPHLLKLLREDLPPILSAPAEDARWHLQFRCSWCRYTSHCMSKMRGTDDVSRLPNLTTQAKHFLQDTLDVHDLNDLSTVLQNNARIDELLEESASLTGQRPILLNQTHALLHNQVHHHPTPPATLAQNEPNSITLTLTLQSEPFHHSVYLFGLHATSDSPEAQRLLGGPFGPRPHVLLARKPDQCEALSLSFLHLLHDTLTRIHRANEGRPYDARFGVQVVLFTPTERSALFELLLTTARDPEHADLAQSLTLALLGPEQEATHNAPVCTPLLILLEPFIRASLALPIDVAYTLPEILDHLNVPHAIQRDERFHYPLGNSFRSDPILVAWGYDDATTQEEFRTQTLLDIETTALQTLTSISDLTRTLRTRLSQNLIAQAPKFTLFPFTQLQHPTLALLAFFSRYESLTRLGSMRGARRVPVELQKLRGHVLELEAVDGTWMRVHGHLPPNLECDNFPAWLLVPDSGDGQRAQLSFRDYHNRRNVNRLTSHEHRAVASLCDLLRDEDGHVALLKLNLKQPFKGGRYPQKNGRYLLYRRFFDFNIDRVIQFLRRLDSVPPSRLLDALAHPSLALRPSPLPQDLDHALRTLQSDADLTPSKLRALDSVRSHPMTGIWGPPGTGKTHALAVMVLLHAAAYARLGRPFRALVTAFTHAAIENLLKKIRALRRRNPGFWGGQPVQIAKAGRWQGLHREDIEVVDTAAISQWLASDQEPRVVGATTYACLKQLRNLEPFQLVIIDEASQLRVPEALVPASLVAQDGRFVLAGDHEQLPPILAADYPSAHADQTTLHRSVFEALQSIQDVLHRTDPSKPPLVIPLLENFRMNHTLTNVAQTLLYPGYTCADAPVASQRLRWDPPKDLDPLIDACLDPDWPLVLLVHRSPHGSRESLFEARFVADCVAALRLGLCAPDGKVYKDDASFFRDGVFVVSPHHSQLRLIRQEIHARRDWSSEPFVDTVDKMQGQEAEAVLVSYGVSDVEFASREAAFIYSRNRLNVSMTRARCKTVVCLPQPLVDASPNVLEDPEAAQGLAFMRQILRLVRVHGEILHFSLSDDFDIDLYRFKGPPTDL